MEKSINTIVGGFSFYDFIANIVTGVFFLLAIDLVLDYVGLYAEHINSMASNPAFVMVFGYILGSFFDWVDDQFERYVRDRYVSENVEHLQKDTNNQASKSQNRCSPLYSLLRYIYLDTVTQWAMGKKDFLQKAILERINKIFAEIYGIRFDFYIDDNINTSKENKETNEDSENSSMTEKSKETKRNKKVPIEAYWHKRSMFFIARERVRMSNSSSVSFLAYYKFFGALLIAFFFIFLVALFLAIRLISMEGGFTLTDKLGYIRVILLLSILGMVFSVSQRKRYNHLYFINIFDTFIALHPEESSSKPA